VPTLRSLDRRFYPHAAAFFKEARRVAGAGLVVTSARRTRREQERLYQAFLAGKNDGLPASPPGYSSHELGLAWDMARLNVDPLKDQVLWQLGAMWRGRGGIWWEGDPVHFAASPGMLKPGRVARHPRRRRASRSK
jgi:hypothetical protein